MTQLTTTQQAELEGPVVRTAYFLELALAGGTLRLSAFNQSYTWGGFQWLGLGQILSISEVSAAEGVDPRALTVALSAQASLLAVAVGPVEEYRGRSAKLYMAPLDAGFALVGTPVLAWRGVVDTVAIGVDGESGSVQITCETAAYALRRRPVHRINAAQHKLRHPGETGLDYLNNLIANPQVWLSKKFQAI